MAGLFPLSYFVQEKLFAVNHAAYGLTPNKRWNLKMLACFSFLFFFLFPQFPITL